MLLRDPNIGDGVALNKLVEKSPPLDQNSCYCNLLQCTHFSETGVAAEQNGQLMGFISGYWIPRREQELFVWQVMVAPEARGQGLSLAMLEWLVGKLNPCALETSITENNAASWALFNRLAESRNALLTDTGSLFDSQQHFDGSHETERLVRIAPQIGEVTL